MYNLNRGEFHHCAVLDWGTVERMRRLREIGMSIREISRRFGLNYETARKAINGHTWRNH